MKEITDMFADKLHKLYNCVSYNVEDICVRKHDIENAVGSKCMFNCVHVNHTLHLQITMMLLKNLSIQNVMVVQVYILSDDILHSEDSLACYLALLFTSMLRHGSSQDGILFRYYDSIT